MACYCCVLGCKNNNHKSTSKHFFRFPKNDEKRSKLWKRFARKPRDSIKITSVICEDHFDERYIRQKDKKLKLSSDAIPTNFFKNSNGEILKIAMQFNGEDYFGEDADEMNKLNNHYQDQEVIDIETAFVNEQLKLDDLKSRCRFCAEVKEETIKIKNFATYNIEINNFMRLLDLTINNEQEITSLVCEECFNQVLLIDTFIVKCRSADQYLNDEFGKLKNVKVQSVEQEEESVQEEIIEMEHDGEENYTETIEETANQEPIYTITYEGEEELKEKSTEDDEDTKKHKLPDYAIINPSLNKFAKKSYNCEYCHKVFAGLKTYKNHVCDVSEIQCADCGDIFDTVFAMKSHRKHLHNDNHQKNYCSSCKTVITGNQTVFKKHKTKCNREKTADSFKCEICQKAFSTLHAYTVHQMFHENKQKTEEDVLAIETVNPKKRKPEIICELCGKIYTTVGDCKRHIKLKHTEITEVFSCDICNKNYPSKSVLKDHFRNTHVINEVPCTFCGKVFRNKTHLKKHMVYHDDKKKIHKCLICPDQPGFINKVGLMRHQARHASNDEKVNFNCEICVTYNFHTSFQLKSHLKHVHGIDQ